MGYDRPPREMHDATCGDCGKECQVPFEPRQDKPVYCNDCFQDHKPARNDRGGGRFGGNRGGGRFGSSEFLISTNPFSKKPSIILFIF